MWRKWFRNRNRNRNRRKGKRLCGCVEYKDEC